MDLGYTVAYAVHNAKDLPKLFKRSGPAPTPLEQLGDDDADDDAIDAPGPGGFDSSQWW